MESGAASGEGHSSVLTVQQQRRSVCGVQRVDKKMPFSRKGLTARSGVLRRSFLLLSPPFRSIALGHRVDDRVSLCLPILLSLRPYLYYGAPDYKEAWLEQQLESTAASNAKQCVARRENVAAALSILPAPPSFEFAKCVGSER